ncbi:NADPH-adrenodoxin reductase, partial [Kickxella alabastrina]
NSSKLGFPAFASFSTTRRLATDHNIAIVGGGAAGLYTASRILSKSPTTRIDIFEQLPTPQGLVRYGVAPDHPEVKNCTTKFNQVLQNPQVQFYGNIPVGTESDHGCSVPLERLRSVYGGVVLAYGASKDRKLGIEGEDGCGGRVGVVSARLFVAWYNGLPEAQDVQLDLESFDRMVIVGHGNVALDCARILLTDPNDLARTDITERAVAALRKSNVRHVEMVGRRGPLQVSFTTKELREMTKMPGLEIICDRRLLESECAGEEGRRVLEASRPLKRMMDLLLKHSVDSNSPKPINENELGAGGVKENKTFTLRFLLSPLRVLYNQVEEGLKAPQVMEFVVNRLSGPPESARAQATSEKVDIACCMALRSIGYASTPLVGAPFDHKRNIVPNIAGRVTVDQNDRNDLVPGLYVSGWVKRGPVGVIATTMQDAYRTADVVLMDIRDGNIGTGCRADIDNTLRSLGVDARRVSTEGWLRLEAYEAARGEKAGKPREKVTSVEEMLNIINQ